jgi:hypothetical protein
MSLVEQDILHNQKPIIFVLNAKSEVKIIGVYSDLSEALKCFYLADELGVLLVNYLDYRSKPCINDTYDCLIGKFYFKDDELIYQRNLTGEIECISDNSVLIKPSDFQLIKDELDKIETEQQKREINDYHVKAHDVVDRAIIEKFNALSALLTKFNKKLAYHNDEYDMGFDYDLTTEINKFYQDSNDNLGVLTLAKKVEIIKKTDESISKINNELLTLKELSQELGEPDTEHQDAWATDFFDEDETFVMDDIDSYFKKNHLDRDRNHHKITRRGEPGGEMLYGSPPPSPQNKSSIHVETIKVKEKDQTKKKTVVFDLDKTEYY